MKDNDMIAKCVLLCSILGGKVAPCESEADNVQVNIVSQQECALIFVTHLLASPANYI